MIVFSKRISASEPNQKTNNNKPCANFFDFFSKFFAICLKFFLRLAGFSMFLDLLGPVRMHSDPFGCSRMHSEAFGCVRTHSEKFRKFETNFGPKHQFFAIFANFLRSWSKMDLKINFRVKFCSRYTYPEVCATRNREKKSRTRPPPDLLPRLVPGSGLDLSPMAIRGGV